MLSSVLKSKKAINVNIAVMRAFVLMKQYALAHEDLTQKLTELETRFNQQFSDIYQALNFLVEKKEIQDAQEKRTAIGYKIPKKRD